MSSFNLVDEPWIPCLMPDQSRVEFRLQQVLVRAHEISEIFDPSPLVTTGLHRLLLAILHRNFGPATLDEWKRLWAQGQWDEKTLTKYFSQWHHRFDLFDRERPFYQVPEMDGAKTHPVQILAAEAAAGNNATLFDHNFSAWPLELFPAQAARYVIARQGFSSGGGKSNPFNFHDSPLIRGYTVLTMGNSLWETLALNLIAYNEEKPFPHSNQDLPIWEQDHLPESDEKGTPLRGYLHYLTWQSRRIYLFPEKDSHLVRFCQIQQCLKLPDPRPSDPFKCYRRDEQQGWFPLGLNPERILWRDSHTLFQMVDESFHGPEVFEWVGRIEKLRRTGKIAAQRSYRFQITGLATEAGKAANLILWRHERLPLPLAYLEEKDLLDRLRDSISLAEELEKVLTGSIRRLARLILAPESDAPGSRQPDKQEVGRLLQSLAPRLMYWSKLDSPFRKFMTDLAEDRSQDEDGEVIYGQATLPYGVGTLRQAAIDAFKEPPLGFEISARTLKALAKAKAQFWSKLTATLTPWEKEVNNESIV
jgi:CRISPR system Cascade subunit CasA